MKITRHEINGHEINTNFRFFPIFSTSVMKLTVTKLTKLTDIKLTRIFQIRVNFMSCYFHVLRYASYVIVSYLYVIQPCSRFEYKAWEGTTINNGFALRG